jgi:hypothetical protein
VKEADMTALDQRLQEQLLTELRTLVTFRQQLAVTAKQQQADTNRALHAAERATAALERMPRNGGTR